MINSLKVIPKPLKYFLLKAYRNLPKVMVKETFGELKDFISEILTAMI